MTTTPREEATRKAVHVIVSLVAAAAVWWLPHIQAAIVITAATFVALMVELARRASGGFGRFFHRHLGHLLRTGETVRLTGATTLAVGYTLAVLILPGVPALAGIVVAGVADAAAAVVGRKYGRVRYPGGKSLEGSIAFLVVVLPLSLMLPGLTVGAAIGLAVALTAVEALTLPVDDNLYLPITTAGAVQLGAVLSGVTFFS